MTDGSDWNLLSSNESGSDVYWPESEFDDTVSLVESLTFTDGDFGDDELRDLVDPEVEYDDGTKFMKDDATLIDENMDETPLLSSTQSLPDNAVELNPTTEPTSEYPNQSSPTSSPEVMEGMVSFIETAVRTMIDILNDPEKLFEVEFVKSLLHDMEWDCLKLKDDAHPCPSLVERINSLISMIVDCGATPTISETGVHVEPTQTEVDIRESTSEDVPPRVTFDTGERDSQLTAPELRPRPEQTPTSSASVVKSAEILQSSRQSYNTHECRCPSPCRSHPSVFPDTISPSVGKCVKAFILECVHCYCESCSGGNASNQPQQDPQKEEISTKQDKAITRERKSELQEVESDSNWKLVEGHLQGSEKHVKDSWKNVQKFLGEEYVGRRYEKERRPRELKTVNMIASGFPMGGLYFDRTKRLGKKGFMVQG